MKTICSVLLAVITICAAKFVVECRAMVAAPGTSISANSGHDRLVLRQQNTGLFGGVKNNRFLLILSEGVRRYFGVNSETKVIMGGRQIPISQLPLNAHIKVITKKAVVLEVDVLEGEK